MLKSLKAKRELVFLLVSLVLLVITVLYTFQIVRFLVVEVSGAVTSRVLLDNQEPVNFNLEKFEELGLNPSQ